MRAPWRNVGLGGAGKSTSEPAHGSRRATIAGCAIALSAALALTGCGSSPRPDSASGQAAQGNRELHALIDGAPALVVGGERLHVALLRHFYQRRGFALVWPTRQSGADSLIEAVLQAGDQGLDPALFHASLLRHRASLSPVDRDLLLSDAFLSYADALARGAVPVERRRDDEVLAPDPVDVAEVLDEAADSANPAAMIEALAPTTPTYRALRLALRNDRADDITDDVAAINRVRAIEVNLERQRWLPRRLPADRVWVNVADERLVLYRADRPVFSTRVVVGQDAEHNQSPEFHAMIDASFYNPPWVIPRDIATAEILPKLNGDPDYLTRNQMVLLTNGEVEQLPGPEAGLGLIMFDMPNRFDVYLHDTPDKSLFGRDNRRISHGCIRVQNPRELAALLLRQPIDTIDQGIAMGGTTRHKLPTSEPVFVVYETASADADGTLHFYPDFYNRDLEIWRKLKGLPQHQEPSLQADNRPTSLKPL